MSRSTRSRAPAMAQMEAKLNTNSKRTNNKKIVKCKNVKVKSTAKKIADENEIPRRKSNNKLSSAKVLCPNTLESKSKIQYTKNEKSLKDDNAALTMKSPVLRDRTNTTNELAKVDIPLKKDSMALGKNNKLINKEFITKSVKKNNHSNKIKESIKQNDVKIFASRKTKTKKINLQDIEELTLNNVILDNIKSTKTSSRKLSKTDKENEEVSNINIDQETTSNKKLESSNNNLAKTRGLKRRNISIEDVEQLLNEDENVEPTGCSININSPISSNAKKVKKNDLFLVKVNDNVKETEVEKISAPVKKFFKNKGEDNIKITNSNTNNLKRTANNRKKVISKRIKSNDSNYSSKTELKKSVKAPEKILRRRAAINYCEVSKLSQSTNLSKDNVSNENEVNKQDKKGVPIYKTIRLSQENSKENITEKVYDFPDDSQENIQKSKKRKKVIKRVAIKRAKKLPESQPVIFAKRQKIGNKKVPREVHFEEKCRESIHIETDIPTEKNSPRNLEHAGDSTIAEASTIIIKSQRKLEGSKRISLTATPPVPKTITSELKLFGPKNAITSEPTTSYSNMVNHSLIRKSMSPITKLVDDFDAGSPWRAVETFSHVNKMVQSTPQIHRLPFTREKKLPLNKLNANKKSFCSEDTVHVTSIIDPKSGNNLEATCQMKKNGASPRKFGTVISNLSPEQLKDNNVNSISPTKQSEQSFIKTVSPSGILSRISVDLDKIPTILVDHSRTSENKENIIPSPKKSPKKKFSVPSPFRFEKLRSAKKTTSAETASKLFNSSSQNESEDLEPKPGPSRIEKPVILRQTNLNNFLNLDETPEASRISTQHGIFDDVHSTPINGKKRKNFEDQNIENAFGFDDYDDEKILPAIETKSTSIIATETDVKKSVKGKIFPKARVKSSVPSRISKNTIKDVLLKNCVQKNKLEDVAVKKIKKTVAANESDKIINDVENNNDPIGSVKSSILDAASFSDTFDMLSEDGEAKVSDEIPLFVDLEPLHFNKPPRRSYNKRKRAVCFDISGPIFNDEDDDEDDPKPKKKKESKQSKEERKRLQEWVKNVNDTFEEIDQFDLIVE